MDLAQVGIVGMVVLVVIDAIKEQYPLIKGNLTRLIALIIGAIIGYMAQTGIIQNLNIDLVGGVFAGVAAVAGNTLAVRAGGDV